MRIRYFQKLYLISALVILAFIYAGLMMGRLLLHSTSGESIFVAPPSVANARLINRLNPNDPIAAIKEYDELRGSRTPIVTILFNEKGEAVYPKNAQVPFRWSDVILPKAPFEAGTMAPNRKQSASSIYLLPGEPKYYVYARNTRQDSMREIVGWIVTSIVVSILLGVAASMAVLFVSLRSKIDLADSVLKELQSGNLKARFPIKRMDEIGQAMSRFNRMADEIERLVEQIRASEKSRMTLLQELAHDLRTPVASLKNLLETLDTEGIEHQPALHSELVSLAVKEVDYFEHLVEDLLFLAQVSEPRYCVDRDEVILNNIIEEEVESLASKYRSANPGLRINKNLPAGAVAFEGDAHLIRRMLRNVLDNAFSLTRSDITVDVVPSGEEVTVSVRDNGSGFSKSNLMTYGVRRANRVLKDGARGRLSVGLGSVIIRTIANLHRGSVTAKNVVAGDSVLGAQVNITLPLSH